MINGRPSFFIFLYYKENDTKGAGRNVILPFGAAEINVCRSINYIRCGKNPQQGPLY